MKALAWHGNHDVRVLAGVLIAGLLVEASDGGGLGARQVWLYAVILTVGYMISRQVRQPGAVTASPAG